MSRPIIAGKAPCIRPPPLPERRESRASMDMDGAPALEAGPAPGPCRAVAPLTHITQQPSSHRSNQLRIKRRC